MKKLFIIILFFPFILFSQNQNNANWFFGDSLMLNFNDVIITPSKVPGYAHEASISYSDDEGNLLFYRDGGIIWNKNFEQMENTPLDQKGYTEGSGSSMCQGSIVIPNPGNSEEYYIINQVSDGLRYSIIDMTLNGGLGDVTEDKKDIWIIEEYITEKLQAVKHANGRDWWVLFHKRMPSFEEDSTNTFYKLLITPEGIQGPYEQNVGLKSKGTLGQMVFSRDGSLLAYPEKINLEIFNFDRCSGELNVFKKIDTVSRLSFEPYACAFSPDGTKIYLSNGIPENNKIYQYCLDCDIELESTQKLIFKNTVINYIIGQMLLAADDKIYFTTNYYILPSSEFTEWNMNLSVISNPNNEGLSCNVDTNTIWLGGQRSIAGLPNMPNYNLGALAGSECDTIVASIQSNPINNNEITIYPNPATDNLFIKTNNIHFSSLIIHITDATGKNILTQNITSDNTKINIAPFSNGIYFISIKQDNEIIYSDSFVKQ